MGASTYSSHTSSTSGAIGRRRNYTQEKTQMETMIEKMKAVEAKRKALDEAKDYLESAEETYAGAREELRRSQEEVMRQIDQLDPETQNILRSMLDRLDGRNGNSRRDDR